MSSVRIDLEQMLEAALSATEAGNVNFNALRGFLLEILKHLNIRRKTILINENSDNFKSVYDMFLDGSLQERGQSPLDLDMIQDRASPGLPDGIKKETPKRSTSAQSRGSDERATPVKETTDNNINDGKFKSETGIASPDLASTTRSPVLSVTPPPPRSTTNIHKTSSRSAQSLDNTGLRGEVKTIKKALADLQSRMENLENPVSPIKVRSTASMFLQGESKTPAHDMMELINIERKVEASETKLLGLSEMIDVMSSSIHELKPKIDQIDEVSLEIEQMKNSLEEIEKSAHFQAKLISTEENTKVNHSENEEREKMLAEQDELDRKLDDLTNELKSLTSKVHAYKHEAERKIQHEINQLAAQFLSSKDDQDAPPIVISNEPPKEVYEALDKCEELQETQTQIEHQVKSVEDRVEVLETFSRDTSKETSAANGFIQQLRSELQAMDTKTDKVSKSLTQSVTRLNVEKEQMSKNIDENKLLLQQVSNNQSVLEKEIEKINTTLQALIAEKEDLKSHSMHRTQTRSFADGSEDISLIRTMIFDLQEEKDKLKHVNKNILEQIYLKQKGLDELHEQLATIQAIKADKDIVTNEIKFKADKRDVELKVEREDFDRYIGLFDQSLRDLLQRLEGLENVLRETMDNITGHIRTKLDKAEVEPLKLFLEERLKAYKPKPIDVRPPPEDYAAGFRKVLIKNFSCISCDRPVEFARDGMFPPLPSTQPMPIKKSNRPYTTYELDQVRQHMIRGGLEVEQERFEAIDNRRKRLQNELLKLSGTQNIEQLAEVIDRPCGGSHTLSFPHSKSIIRGLHLNKEEMIIETAENNFKSLQNVDIMGQDGHIYKGLVEDAPVVLPQINEKPLVPSIPPTAQKTLEEAGRNRSTTPADEKLIVKDHSNLIDNN